MCKATLSLLSASLLATSGDITLTWLSPMLPKLYSNDTSINPIGRSITAAEDEWIGSLINIGAIVGPLPFSYISEHFGRKIALLSIAIPHIVAYLSMAFGTSVGVFYFGRLFGGLAVGGGYTLLPLYVAEVADEAKRGVFSVLLGVFWGIGDFLPNTIGSYMSVKSFNIAMAIFPISFLILFALLGYESPYYLVGANKMVEAENILKTLRKTNEIAIKAELKEIHSNIQIEGGGHWSDIVTNPGLRKAFFISVMLIVFQQLSGINAISFYLIPIFDESKVGLRPEISSIMVSAVSLSSSAVIPFMVNRFNRKSLLVVSYVFMMIFLGMLGAFFYLKDDTAVNSDHLGFMPVASVILYILAYQIGSNTLPWTVSSELFPKNVKQISSSATSCTCYIASFFITKYFLDMKNALGVAGTYWCFSVCCLLSVAFTIFLVPETKGKTFSEIQDMVQK